MISHPPYLLMSPEQQRVRTAATVRSEFSRVLLVIACASIVWILDQWPGVSLLQSIPGVSITVRTLRAFALPKCSLATALFLVGATLTLIIWILAQKLTAYQDLMKGPEKMKNLEPEPSRIFFARARLIERIRSVAMAMFIGWGYLLLFQLGKQWYPQQFAAFVSALY